MYKDDVYEVAKNAKFPSPPPVDVNSIPDEFELSYDIPSVQLPAEVPIGHQQRSGYVPETIEEISESEEEYNFTEDDLDKIRDILRQNVKSNRKSLPIAKGQDLNRKNSSTTSGLDGLFLIDYEQKPFRHFDTDRRIAIRRTVQSKF